MKRHIAHNIIDSLNNSGAHIGYASWFSAPDILSMMAFFAAALVVTIQLMPLGKKH